MLHVAAWAVGGVVIVLLVAALQVANPYADVQLSAGVVAVAASVGAAIGTLGGEQSARSRAESDLAAAAMAASHDGIAVLDEQFTYVTVNGAYADLYGVDDGDRLVGEEWRCRDHLEAEERFEAEILRALGTAERWRGETEGVRFDGSTFPTEVSVAPLAEGGYVVVVRDVSDRRNYEKRLEALHAGTRELYAAESRDAVLTAAVDVAADVLDEPNVAAWVPDEDGTLRPVAATDAARSLAATAEDRTLPDLPPASGEGRAFRDGEVRVVDYDALEDPAAPDVPLGTVVFVPLGQHALVALASRGERSLSERDRYLVEIYARNATAALDAVAREAELGRREERLRTVVENAPVALYVYDDEGTFTLLEGSAFESFPLDSAEMVGASVFDLFAGEQAILDAAEAALDGRATEITTDLFGRTYEFATSPILEQGEVDRVVGVAVDVTERARYRDRVEALHAATREMLAAPSRDAVCEVVVDTAREVLDQPVAGVWLADEDEDVLEPVAATESAREMLGDLPSYRPGESLSWRAYATGELAVYDAFDEEAKRHEGAGMFGSALLAPIGDHGVLDCAAAERNAFDESAAALVGLLAANASMALDRVGREQALERQTERMEFFNSILRHDVLNGMTVIRARGELLAESLADPDERRHAETFVRWSDDVVDVVTRVRSVVDALSGASGPDLGPVDLSSALRAEVDRIRATYDDVTVRSDVPDGLTVVADDLLGEVLGNVVTNAVEHGDRPDLVIAVSARRTDGEVTVRVADSGAGVPPERREAIFRRGETGHAKRTGSGFGLFFVDVMLDAYGGEVSVGESDLGGAEFVLTFRAAGRQGNHGAPETSEE